ncbi:hypothetical protein EI94DRAFT_1703814 [Lactarius quietus]|nr:hypothetical protein EI94DRAFT_1703814 [Lactarius quietus]
MSPTHHIINSPLPSPTFSEPSQLVVDQDTLLDIAIHVDAAIREFKAKNEDVDVPFFVKSIDEELESVNAIFLAYPETEEAPKYHPIIGYVAWLMDTTLDTKTALMIFDFLEVAQLCAARARETSNPSGILNQPNLSGLVTWVRHGLIAMADPSHDDVSDDGGEAPDSPESPDIGTIFAVTPEPEDVDMDDDHDGETYCRQTRSSNTKHDASGRRMWAMQGKAIDCIYDEEKKGYVCDACTAAKIRCYPLNKKVEAAKLKSDAWDMVITGKKAADDTEHPAKKQPGRKPQDTTKAESSRGRPKKHNVVDAVDDNTAALHALHACVVQAVEKLEKDIVDGDHVLGYSCGRSIPHLNRKQHFLWVIDAYRYSHVGQSEYQNGWSSHCRTISHRTGTYLGPGYGLHPRGDPVHADSSFTAPSKMLRSTSEQTRGTTAVKPPHPGLQVFPYPVGRLRVAPKYISLISTNFPCHPPVMYLGYAALCLLDNPQP